MKSLTASIIIIFIVLHSGQEMTSGQDKTVFDQVHIGWRGAFAQGFIQDKDGFFWIGTQGALYKWNGIGLTRYSPVNSDLADATITAILEDQDEMIWIGTMNGLSKYDKNTDRFTSYKHDPADPTTLSHNTIGSVVQPQTLAEDSSGVLWIGTQHGLNRYDKETDTFASYLYDADKDTSISHNTVSAMYEDSSKVFWIGTQGGLNRFDRETGAFTRYLHDPDDPTSISGDRVTTMLEDREGMFWIGIEGGGLNKFERETGMFTRYQHNPENPHSIISNNVNVIVEAVDGNLWLSHYPTVAGVSIFNKATGAFTNIRSNPKDPLSLSENHINDIYQDKQGGIWAIAQTGTVNRYDPNISKIMTLRHDPDDPNTLSSSNVYPLFEDRNGTMWAGMKEEFGLNEYVRETKSFSRHHVAQVYSIYEGSAGDFWVGTVHGKLHQYDRTTRRIVNTYDVSTSFVPAIIEDPADHDLLWVATHKDGLVKVHKASGKMTHYRHNPEDPDSIGVSSVWSIDPENEDIFWLGTYGGGINRFDKIHETFTRYIHDDHDPHSISNNIGANMAMTASGEIWIITQGGGLNRFDKETGHFERYSLQEGNFPANNLSSILEDHAGQLWITSNELGIIKFNPKSKTYKIYSESDGVQGGAFWFVGKAKSRTGELWFGGSEGLNVVQPEQMKVNPLKPPVFLTSLTQGGEPLEIGKAPERLEEIRLHWREPFFEFEFAALNYISAGANQYAYMLEGRDRDWYYSGTNPSGRYTGLEGGEYRLKFKGSNNDGVWNEVGIALKVVVEPPFWETWWFYGAISLFSIAVIQFVIYYMLKLNSEVTERKKAEGELREHRDQLEETVKTRTAELQRAKETAETSNRAKSIFLANMSHELRTPLNAILGFARIMIRSRTLASEHQENAGIISRSGEHLLMLINQVLDLSKIEAGRITLNEKNVDLYRFLDDLEDMFHLKADDKRLQLLVEWEARIPRHVRTDEVKLRQVLINLLNNAIKFTEEGSVQLRMRNEELGMKNIEHNSSFLILNFSVADTGPGIAPEEMDKLFEAFAQTTSGRQAQEGTGLGLPISRKFVQLMGGDMHVESKVGRGATFMFDIKVTVMDETAIETVTPIQRVIALEPGQPRYRLLIVDDKWTNRHLLIKLLNPFGFELREATNGQEAIDIWEEWKPHLIWMDMRMPVLDGYEATKRIKNGEVLSDVEGMKNEGGDRETVIVALTASALEEERAAILATGCDDYLRKPYRDADIFACLHRHLGLRFVYEEEKKSTSDPLTSSGHRNRQATIEKTLTPEALAALPIEWVVRLEQGTRIVDLELLDSVIEQIRERDAFLADALTYLVEDYEYGKILTVIQEVRD